jgi:hypothetical protein
VFFQDCFKQTVKLAMELKLASLGHINRLISSRMNCVKITGWREQKNEAKSAKKSSKP